MTEEGAVELRRVCCATEITNFKEGSILDNNIIHMNGLEVGEAFRQRNEMVGVVGPVELEQLGLSRVVVPGPSKLTQSSLQVCVRSDRLVRWEVDEKTWTGPWCSGCARVRWFVLLEGFTGRVGDESGDSSLVEYPDSGHGFVMVCCGEEEEGT